MAVGATMTNDTDELRQRVDRLESRVAELERLLEQDGQNHSEGSADGLDSRDAAVVGALEHGESYTRRELMKLYMKQTDIRREKTAKRRTKQLVQRDFFQPNGSRLTYRG